MLKVIVCIVWYIGVWIALTLWMVRIKQKAGEFDAFDVLDNPAEVFWVLSIWPFTAPPWFLWRGVKWIIDRMEDGDDE